ncbi:protein gp37 [Pseudaminobacter salicylatoxidans]|uniref:Protein gp37 n=1 Tax=Pseudaminobacter salicylatoxidans TaxID=93369 RepID=A0A316C0N1_PSESE|nr:phage Gp37/Gp68 family protein [Pseudaminobacter salicylatoxidans]PWJ81560.1 protein gp37 [Pseudaminobacter salicylatoxidans]
MGEITAISWCDATFNPWIGCTKVSPACDGCYAEALMDKRYGRVQWGAPGKGNGTRVRTSPGNWSKPKAWDRKAAASGKRPFVFCSSLADVFDNQVPVEWRRDLFDLIRATPNLTWLLLTKRPQLIVRLYEEAQRLKEDGTRWTSTLPRERSAWPRNAAIGTTIEDQERAELNEPHLLYATDRLKPAFNFLSCEPLLGPLMPWTPTILARTMDLIGHADVPSIDWVITGGETDQGMHKARPSHPSWFRAIRDRCAAAGVPFHHKQNGEWIAKGWEHHGSKLHLTLAGKVINKADCDKNRDFPGMGLIEIEKVGKHRAGRLLDGVEHNARPKVVT